MGTEYKIEGLNSYIHEGNGTLLVSSAPDPVSDMEVGLFDGDDIYVGALKPGGENTHTYEHWVLMKGTSSDGVAQVHVS